MKIQEEKTNEKKISLGSIIDDIMCEIFIFSHPVDILEKFRLVCRRFDFITKNEYLWKKQLENMNYFYEIPKSYVEVFSVFKTLYCSSGEDLKDFDDFKLNYKILRGIYAYGFEFPSEIQKKVIFTLTTRKDIDLMVVGMGGTGRTSSFIIGMMQKLNDQKSKLQGLVLSHSRENAIQIAHVFKSIGTFTKFKTYCCVGGVKVSKDIEEIKKGVHIVVGTPGRVNHLIEESRLPTKDICFAVINGADTMILKGFKDSVCKIFKYLKKNIQTLVTTSVVSSDAKNLCDLLLKYPKKIIEKREENLTLEGIRQFYVHVQHETKFNVLMDIYKTLTITRAVIYVNSRKKTDLLYDRMKENDFDPLKLNSEKDKEKIIKDFKNGKSRVLICYDSENMRVQDRYLLTFVINFDFPRRKESYLRRIGRSGAYGRKGICINLIYDREVSLLDETGEYFQTKIDPLPNDIQTYL